MNNLHQALLQASMILLYISIILTRLVCKCQENMHLYLATLQVIFRI